MDYKITFPNGHIRALTFSYDDGTEYDRRLVDIFDRYHLKATFHLNSGVFGMKHSAGDYILADEVEELYDGHEVSAHTFTHPFPSHLTRNQLLMEMLDDKRTLERLCNYPVRGMSYPFGEFFDEMIDVAGAVGLEYSRTVESTHNFNLPVDFMHWNPTCHHNDAPGMLQSFNDALNWRSLSLFYIWGHSFEFEKENTWDMIENFCKEVSSYDDVWFATNIEIKDYLTAVRSLKVTVDNDIIYNPSALTVYFTAGGKLYEVKAGETIKL